MFLRNRIIKKAKCKREKFKNLLVIGITGSYGKTTTKEFLYEILSKKFNVLKTEKHQNSEIGIANCILGKLTEDHEIFIVEMGAYNKGGIKMICDMVKPKIGILTGINEQHLATFGSIKNITETKYELIEGLPQDGIGILNGNNNIIWDLREKTKKQKLKKVIFSSIDNQGADILAKSIQEKKDSLLFDILVGNERQVFNLKLLGKQNIENVLLAIACSLELGMSLGEISNICENIRNIVGMMKLSKGINGIDLVESTYSANPSGVIAHLSYLRKWDGRKIVIMPCLIELAQSSSKNHEMIGEKIGEVCDLAIITTKDKIAEIKKGAFKKQLDENSLLIIESPKEIYKIIKNKTKKGDVVLLEGRLPTKLIEFLKNGI
jgi:UDP-N-acetylmuramoyl-tripeptide--D-alanyl-D-alanine ligase